MCSPLVFAFVSSGCDEQNLGGQSADGAPVLGMKASHCVLLTKDPFHMSQAIQLRDVTIWICNFLSTEGLYFYFFTDVDRCISLILRQALVGYSMCV